MDGHRGGHHIGGDAGADLTDQNACAEVVMPNWVGICFTSTLPLFGSKARNQNLHGGNGKDMIAV
jgi:hypothetical protein